MGNVLLRFNFSRPRRLIELSSATQMVSRMLAENSQTTDRSGIPGSIGLVDDRALVLRREATPLRPGGHFGIRKLLALVHRRAARGVGSFSATLQSCQRRSILIFPLHVAWDHQDDDLFLRPTVIIQGLLVSLILARRDEDVCTRLAEIAYAAPF